MALKHLHKPSSGVILEGWALNVSRGGIRVILEDKIEPGDEVEVTLFDAPDRADGLASSQPHRGCVVWVQEESDGVIAGIAFKDAAGASSTGAPGSETVPE